MNLWLFKEEPTHYSYADLERDGETSWAGVANALALKHLRQCRVGDRVFYDHTGKEKAIVAEMVVTKAFTPKDADDKEVIVKVKPKRRLLRPVTLTEIKAQKALAGWSLVKMSRLSVMPVTPAEWDLIERMAEKPV